MGLDGWVDAAERWITARRVKAAAMVVLAGNILVTIGWLASQHGLIDTFHQPLGGDFIIFYAASSLTLTGKAALAFSAKALLATERTVVAGTPAGLVWSYPPPFQLAIAPLALAPFTIAYGLWTALGLTAYLTALRCFSRLPGAALMALAFPGLFVIAWHGQTTLFVTAILGFGLMALDRHPWRAGMILGLLVCKPQFGLILPLLLVGTGRWRSVFGAAVTGLVLVSLSTVVFGFPLWAAFLQNLSEASSWVSSGALPWAKVPTWFVLLAWLGVPHAVAWGCQESIAVAVAAVTVMAWRKPGPLLLKAAMAGCAVLIVTPYVLNYDLVLLAIPIAGIAEYCAPARAPRGTKLIMILAFATPAAFLGLAQRTHAQLMPVAILIVFWGIWRVYNSAIEDLRRVPVPACVLLKSA